MTSTSDTAAPDPGALELPLRSLVGMSQGERRRRARRWVAAHEDPIAEPYWWDEAKHKFRLGQHLRPCPAVTDGERGCPRCNPKLRGFAIWLAPMCDGSGTLPAWRSMTPEQQRAERCQRKRELVARKRIRRYYRNLTAGTGR